MVNKGIVNFSEYVKNVGKKVIDDRLGIHSLLYDDAVASLKDVISKNAFLSSIDFNIDDYIDRYFEVHPYGGDEFSPFYKVGEIPVIIPYAYRKLSIDNNDKYIHEYFIKAVDIKCATDKSDISDIHQSIKNITTSYAKNVVQSRMYSMLEFLTSFDYLEPSAFTFVESFSIILNMYMENQLRISRIYLMTF